MQLSGSTYYEKKKSVALSKRKKKVSDDEKRKKKQTHDIVGQNSNPSLVQSHKSKSMLLGIFYRKHSSVKFGKAAIIFR